MSKQKNEGNLIKVPKQFNLFDHLFWRIFYFISSLLWKIEVNGLNNIPLHTRYIICPNHESDLDAPLVIGALPHQYRKEINVFAAKERLFFRFLKFNGMVFIDRFNKSLGARICVLRLGERILKKERSLLIFPEGKRSRGGEINKLYKGSAYLAIKESIPIMPVRIQGAFAVLPRHKKIPRIFKQGLHRYKIIISFKKPIWPEAGLDVDGMIQRLYEKIAAL